MNDVVQNLRVLMIYIEPAPYILDLIRVLREEYPELRLHVLFIEAAATQPWGEMPEDEGLELLPSGRVPALKRITALIRKGDFEWLHLAGWGHPLLSAAVLIGAGCHRKISMESDTQLPFERSGWKQRVKGVLLPGLFARVNLFLPGGSRQKALFLHYGVPEAKIRVAQMTVDIERIANLASEAHQQRSSIRSALGVAESACLFVYVGRLEAYKGVGLLLQAFEQLEVPDVGLLIVGDGACRSMVETAEAKDERIRYVGRRDFAGVAEAFAISDVAVVPSEFEPWGLVVNEAMAVGLPVIASDRVGAVDDLVVDGESGLVVDAGSITSLQDAMRKLAGDGELCRRLGSQSRNLIRNWDLSAEAVIMVEGWKDA